MKTTVYSLLHDPFTVRLMFDIYAAPHDPEARREDCLSVRVYGGMEEPRRLEFFDTAVPGLNQTPTMVLCPTL